jgi:hypothetical protein
MPKVYSHYDNLKVARDAPPEVIRAAYRRLSQKFHPDRNRGNTESEEVMKLINTAYHVLSDPVRRQAHDVWIISAELSAALAKPPPPSPESVPRKQAADEMTWRPRMRAQAYSVILRAYEVDHLLYSLLWGGLGGLVFAVITSIAVGPKSSNHVSATLYATPDVARASDASSKYKRPFTAPNGAPWPPFAAYVTGYQILKSNGLSKVAIDNGEGNSDVFVKLVALEYDGANAARYFFIPAHGRFVLNNVTPGTYDIRYRNLESGVLSRSDFFRLEEMVGGGKTEFSDVTMSLPTAQSSKMQIYPLSEDEF